MCSNTERRLRAKGSNDVNGHKKLRLRGNSTNAPCGEPILFNHILQLFDRVKISWRNGSATDTEIEIEPFYVLQIAERQELRCPNYLCCSSTNCKQEIKSIRFLSAHAEISSWSLTSRFECTAKYLKLRILTTGE